MLPTPPFACTPAADSAQVGQSLRPARERHLHLRRRVLRRVAQRHQVGEHGSNCGL